MRKANRNKKFLVKVFVAPQNKLIFQKNCMQKHLSMMFVVEEYMKYALDKLSTKEVNDIISSVYPLQTNNTKNLTPIGTRLTDEYWQKLGSYAINNGMSVSKVASCIFNNGLSTADLYKIIEEHGFTSVYKNKMGFNNKFNV